MQRQPKVLDMPALGEVERQQKQRQHRKQNGVHQPRHALEEAVQQPEVPDILQRLRRAEAEGALGKKAGVGVVADRDVERPDRDDDIGLILRNVQIVEAGNLFVLEGGIAVRALGTNQLCRSRRRLIPGW